MGQVASEALRRSCCGDASSTAREQGAPPWAHVEDRRPIAHCCSALNSAFAAHDHEMLDPATGRPFRTDVASMAGLGGDGVGCAQVWSAICVDNGGPPQSVHRGPALREGLGFIDLDLRRVDGEVVPIVRPAQRQLEVPWEFKHVSYDWSAPSGSQGSMAGPAQEKLEACMKLFARAMLEGVDLQLRLNAEEVPNMPQIQDLNATVALTADLGVLVLNVGGVERSIPVSSVRWVRPPEEGGGGLMWFLPSERDKVVVLKLAGGRFVRLKFDRQDQAAYFGTCMRLMVKVARIEGGGPSTRTAMSSASSTMPLGRNPGAVW